MLDPGVAELHLGGLFSRGRIPETHAAILSAGGEKKLRAES